ncbi:MAG: flagellar M-ring protein FliF, partial [Robiginitomaculum sp.]|nr:flagellar M-ring protein FliF [Robiginitomaculum sp.]
DGVDAARVLLVMPDRKLFQTEVNKAKASVTIKLGNNAIGYRQTNAIRHLVSAAVPDLAISGVTVIDDSGRVLAGNNDEGGQGGSETSGRRASIEDALRLKVERVLGSIVGVGGVDVQLNVELDQSRVTERSTIYDPDGQVVISSDTSVQSSNEQDKEQAGSVTVGANVPGDDGATENAAGSSALNSIESETINYGVSKTETTKIHHVGIIKRLSIAVNVDGITGVDDQGNPTWQPRPADEMQSIENLIKSAVGFDAARNDNLQVTNIRFVKPTPFLVDVEAAKPGFTKDDIMRLIEIGILALVSVVMILFLGRPLITALVSGGGGAVMGGGSPSLAIAGGAAGEMPQLTGGQAGSVGQMALPAPDGAQQISEQGLDISKIDGQVKASSIKKVAGIVESHPEESVSILRNWLHES